MDTGIDGVSVYIDDILVTGKMIEEHLFTSAGPF